MIYAVKNCEICGKEINIEHRKRLEAKHLFCSRECYQIYLNNKKNNEDNLNCVCSFCGKKFHRKPTSLIDHRTNKPIKNVYCSEKCLAEHRKILFCGENNHQYGLKGELNSSFKSNEKITHYGYRKIRVLDHPFRDCDDFVFEHRLVAEQYLLTDENSIEIDGKKYLKKEYIVHHKDGNKLNNDVENLEVMLLSEHTKLHRKKEKPPKPQKSKILKGAYVKCKYCGKEFYTNKPEERKCCSIKCSKLYNYTYKNKMGTTITNCEQCGKEIKVKNSRLSKTKHIFCCRECYTAYRNLNNK